VVVKCLFDPMTMDDIEDIAENLPQKTWETPAI
jgi:hypothetical protein